MSKTDEKSNGGSTAGTPRWVKVFGIIAIVLVLLVVILKLTGLSPGGHTPRIIHGDGTGLRDNSGDETGSRIHSEEQAETGDDGGEATGARDHGRKR